MPTYAYRCSACSHEFDTVQRFSDSPLTTCPECGGTIRRVFQPVGVVFKGSGWYINDSRGKSSTTTPAATDTSTKSETKPETKAATSSPATSEGSTATSKAAAD